MKTDSNNNKNVLWLLFSMLSKLFLSKFINNERCVWLNGINFLENAYIAEKTIFVTS